MAIVIPLVMMAVGASTTTIIVTSLVLTAVGANAAIDRAASKVFGKDLVSIADIGGAVFMGASAMGAFGGAEGAVDGAGGIGLAEGETPASLTGGAETLEGGATPAAALTGTPPPASGGALATAAGTSGTAAPPDLSAAAPTPAPDLSAPATSTPDASGLTPGQTQYGMVENGAATTGTATTGTATSGAANTGAATNGVASPTVAPAGAPPKPFPDAVWDKVTGMWKSLGDRGQGALLQVGGNLLAGAANGAAQAKMAADGRAYDAKYRTGSGLKQWAPRQTPYSPPGG